jgi:hypothetical protein
VLEVHPACVFPTERTRALWLTPEAQMQQKRGVVGSWPTGVEDFRHSRVLKYEQNLPEVFQSFIGFRHFISNSLRIRTKSYKRVAN